MECQAWSNENRISPWKTVTDADRRRTGCSFREMTFTMDTQLSIVTDTERISHPEVVTSADIKIITFESSAIPLIHFDVLVKFPNVKEIKVESHSSRLKLHDLNHPIENCQNIKIFSLSFSGIAEIPTNAFKGCPRLSKLTLTYNPIKELRGDEFDQLTGLVELDLAGIRISNIKPTTFQNLTALETLNLSFLSNLKNPTISKELFRNCPNLKSLKLRGNNIRAIDPEAFNNNQKLTTLELNFNDCVSKNFVVSDNKALHWTVVKKDLKECFGNFAKQ